jgi:hypothetical protein
MVEFKVLTQRRKYLLEQIGSAADEIKRIDGYIACQQGFVKRDCPYLGS